MARYYFHIREGDQTIEDHEGLDLPDIAAVQEEVIQAAREIVAELIVQGQPIDEKRFEVVDENGDIVAVFPFRLTLPD